MVNKWSWILLLTVESLCNQFQTIWRRLDIFETMQEFRVFIEWSLVYFSE